MSIPFQATHTADDGRYYMVDGCEWFYANHMGHWKRHWSGAPAGLKAINQQKKQWSGPEDGLPPTGTVCEFNDSCGGQWHKVEIMYVSKHTILIKFFGGEFQDVEGAYSPEESVCFRAIKTPEQLRETAIRELMDIAQVDCRVTAARLVDAGFKRN